MKTKSYEAFIIESVIFVLLFSWLLVISLIIRVDAKSPVETVQPEPNKVEQIEQVDMVATYNVPLDAELQLFIINLCEEHHIDPAVVMAMIAVESEFDVNVIGDNGNAFGLMQIHPRWHQERMDKLGITDLLDPYQNVTVGVDYLVELIAYYEGNTTKALMAYNAGQLGAYNNYFSKGIYSNEYSAKVLDAIENLTEGMVADVLQ